MPRFPKIGAINSQKFWPSDRGPISQLTSLFCLFCVLGAVLRAVPGVGPAQASRSGPVLWEVILGDGDVGSGQLACSLESAVY